MDKTVPGGRDELGLDGTEQRPEKRYRGLTRESGLRRRAVLHNGFFFGEVIVCYGT